MLLRSFEPSALNKRSSPGLGVRSHSGHARDARVPGRSRLECGFVTVDISDPEADLSAAMHDAFGVLALPKPIRNKLKLAVVRRCLRGGSTPHGRVAIDDALVEITGQSAAFLRAIQRSAEKYAPGLVVPPGAISCEIDDPLTHQLRYTAKGLADTRGGRRGGSPSEPRRGVSECRARSHGAR